MAEHEVFSGVMQGPVGLVALVAVLIGLIALALLLALLTAPSRDARKDDGLIRTLLSDLIALGTVVAVGVFSVWLLVLRSGHVTLLP